MVRRVLGFVLVCGFACGAPAADRSDNGKTRNPNAVSVSELLKRAAKSPLGPGEARLLRAVAELIEQEQVPVVPAGVKGSLQPAMISYPRPVAVPAVPPLPGSQAAPSEERKRLAIRLSNAPVDDVIKALEEFRISEQTARPAVLG